MCFQRATDKPYLKKVASIKVLLKLFHEKSGYGAAFHIIRAFEIGEVTQRAAHSECGMVRAVQ